MTLILGEKKGEGNRSIQTSTGEEEEQKGEGGGKFGTGKDSFRVR